MGYFGGVRSDERKEEVRHASEESFELFIVHFQNSFKMEMRQYVNDNVNVTRYKTIKPVTCLLTSPLLPLGGRSLSVLVFPTTNLSCPTTSPALGFLSMAWYPCVCPFLLLAIEGREEKAQRQVHQRNLPQLRSTDPSPSRLFQSKVGCLCPQRPVKLLAFPNVSPLCCPKGCGVFMILCASYPADPCFQNSPLLMPVGLHCPGQSPALRLSFSSLWKLSKFFQLHFRIWRSLELLQFYKQLLSNQNVPDSVRGNVAQRLSRHRTVLPSFHSP